MKIQLRVEPSKLSDYELQVEDDELARLWSRVEDHGGSPGEWIIERRCGVLRGPGHGSAQPSHWGCPVIDTKFFEGTSILGVDARWITFHCAKSHQEAARSYSILARLCMDYLYPLDMVVQAQESSAENARKAMRYLSQLQECRS